MTGPPSGPARATATIAVRVTVTPQVAWEALTHDIDLWWRRGPKYRHAGGRDAPGSCIAIEAGVGGRVLETWEDRGPQEFELGRVTVWEPPHRVAFARSLGMWWSEQLEAIRAHLG